MDIKKSSRNLRKREASLIARLGGANEKQRDNIFRCSLSNEKWLLALNSIGDPSVNTRESIKN